MNQSRVDMNDEIFVNDKQISNSCGPPVLRTNVSRFSVRYKKNLRKLTNNQICENNHQPTKMNNKKTV